MTSTTCATNTTTTTSVTPVTGAGKGSEPCIYECLSNPADILFNLGNPALDITSLENRCQFPIEVLPGKTIQPLFMQCLANDDIKGFMVLGLTNTHSYITMRYLVNRVALTKLCPKLGILNAKTFKFQDDLAGVDKYKALQRYYKLEPFVERGEGLTIIFNQGGLTLKDMKKNNCGVTVDVVWDQISKELNNVPEKDGGPKMISNAPITETRNKTNEAQETRVRGGVGFDGKPTLIEYLALLIAVQKELRICLYGRGSATYGRSSTQVRGYPLAVAGSPLGDIAVDRSNHGWATEVCGAGGSAEVVGSWS